VYVLVRKDLSPGQQVVQSCHAVAEAVSAFHALEQEHPHLIVCEVSDETALRRALGETQQCGIACRPFFEPDLGNQLTALATEPISRARGRRFRKLRLLNPADPGRAQVPGGSSSRVIKRDIANP
jgi:hypothetical protein